MIAFTFYSFLMAIIINCIMIIVMYFLRKSKFFSRSFGIGFMVILYLFCLVRMCVPFEFWGHSIIINDEVVLAGIMNAIGNRTYVSDTFQVTVLDILFVIWLITAAVLIAVFVIRQIRFLRYIKRCPNLASDRETAALCTVATELLGSAKNLRLIKTDAVDAPMITGLFRHIVLLPSYTYDNDEKLEMILTHECLHIKNHDLWIKLMARVYTCVFWWNPLSYLLEKDLSYTLELNCDYHVIRDFSIERRISYFETLISEMKRATESRKAPAALVSSGFAENARKKDTLARFENLVEDAPNKRKQVVVNCAVILMFFVLFCASYFFLWQPAYPDVPIEAHDPATEGVLSDENNSYLVKQPDGSYVFYFEGYEIPVSKEEYDAGGYEIYPVRE